MPRLRRSDTTGAGIRRIRCGRGFRYVGPDGTPVSDKETLARIAALVIPPAWNDVWICPFPNGHLQAIGTDGRGRRQYRYHDAWRARRDQEKFDRMLGFGAALPKLRSQCDGLLAGEGLGRDRVLATATRLLDLGFFRVGGEEYAAENGSYGLATIEKGHARVAGDRVIFEYPAKSGREQLQAVADEAVRDMVSALKRRRGGSRELLAWRDDRGRWVDVRSTDINAFIKEAVGVEYSAKDFRTWTATLLVAVGLAVSSEARSERARAAAVRRAICEASDYLGNTPTVCRTSYVDPRVVDRFRAGSTIAPVVLDLRAADWFASPSSRQVVEAALLDLLGGDIAAAQPRAA